MASRNKGQSRSLATQNGYDPTGWALWRLSLALKKIAESQTPDEHARTSGNDEDNSVCDSNDGGKTNG